MHSITSKSIESLVRSTKILLVDDDYYMRKVIRSLLVANHIKNIHDVADGKSGLEAICTLNPDVVILDWEMPDMTGADFMRVVRVPISFPLPAVPIVMLTGHVERENVVEAIRLGVNEFLCKPVSAKALVERIISVRARPRPMVRIGDYYGPEPRKLVANSKQLTDPAEPVWIV